MKGLGREARALNKFAFVNRSSHMGTRSAHLSLLSTSSHTITLVPVQHPARGDVSALQPVRSTALPCLTVRPRRTAGTAPSISASAPAGKPLFANIPFRHSDASGKKPEAATTDLRDTARDPTWADKDNARFLVTGEGSIQRTSVLPRLVQAWER